MQCSKKKKKGPPDEDPLYAIGRTMFETDTIPSEWVDRINFLDEVWVPTPFHVDSFAKAGVSKNKIFVLGEPVDVDFFDPSIAGSVDQSSDVGVGTGDQGGMQKLPTGKQIDFGIGLHVLHQEARGAGGGEGGAGEAVGADADAGAGTTTPYKFLSIFKFEPRKGWDVLLTAFIEEFAILDPASSTETAGNDAAGNNDGKLSNGAELPELHILTSSFHDNADMVHRLQQHVRERVLQNSFGTTKVRQMPKIYVIDKHVAQRDLPSLYAAADCFVLPSRGEGWGRPHVEAMSMGLPIIATNWSGPTAYMTEMNSYPLAIDGTFVDLISISISPPRLPLRAAVKMCANACRALCCANYLHAWLLSRSRHVMHARMPSCPTGLVPIKTGK